MTEEKLPRDVPLDPMVPGAYYQDYVRTIVAAEVLEVDAATVARYIRDGKLPAIKIGKTWLIKREDVAEFQLPKPGNPAWVNKTDKS
ncbi:helix-turn-helix domain-containing protein [Chloroflexota bacterium]